MLRRHALFKRLYIGFCRGDMFRHTLFQRLYVGFGRNVLAPGSADRGNHGFGLGFLKPGFPERLDRSVCVECGCGHGVYSALHGAAKSRSGTVS